jgi:hypothetical protein
VTDLRVEITSLEKIGIEGRGVELHDRDSGGNFMSSGNRDAVVDELVAQYPLAAQALIAESPRLIRTAFPGVTETADTKARLIC